MRKTLLLVTLAAGLALTGITLATIGEAFADGSGSAGSGSAMPGSGSGMTADDLDDPVLAPVAAFDDARAMHKLGWPLLLLGALIMVAKGLQSAGKRWPKWKWLAWINTGRRAMVLAGALTVGAAAFNTLALGGTAMAVLLAGGSAAFALLHPAAKE